MATPVNPKYPLFLREINKDNTTVGGYPIITVEDNFNIKAEPNTFYNIKNNINSEILITCNQLEVAPTRIYFTYDGSDSDDFGNILSTVGLNIIPDNTKEGYNYKALLNVRNLSGGLIDILELYFTNNIIQGGNTTALLNFDNNEIELHINNINIIKTENIVNEFIFNFNCPCSIIYGNAFTWNKNDIPDLTQQGICTISIVNGIGCYTFVKA